jgi:hypothetical protein
MVPQRLFNPFNRFTRFNRYARFKPPPPFGVAQGMLSSPATRGRMKEGVERLEQLELLNQKDISPVLQSLRRLRNRATSRVVLFKP